MADTRQQCQNVGADLPIISSAEENNFIVDVLQKEGKSWAWVGLQRSTSDLEFYWLNGSALKGQYNSWNDGEPNNSGGWENCAYIMGHISYEGKWNDCVCDFAAALVSPFVLCQRPIRDGQFTLLPKL